MNKLIIIGNGFDLAHGLKTSYCDFILWYLKEELKKCATTNPVTYNGELIGIDLSNASSRDYTLLNSIDEILNYFGSKISYKNKFIEDITKKAARLKWVDIESLYYSHLIGLYMRLSYYQIKNNSMEVFDPIHSELIDLNNSLDIIKRELERYLIIATKDPVTHLNPIQNIIIKILRIPEGSKKGEVYIANFNYTTTIKGYDFPIARTKYINIHGELNNKDNPIILGYGDEMDKVYKNIERLNENEFLRKFKSFDYFKTSNYQALAEFVRKAEFKAYILGHSCGISDRVLFNRIFDNKNCKSIEIFYHERENGSTDYFEKTIELSRHFKPESKHDLRTKIVDEQRSYALKDRRLISNYN